MIPLANLKPFRPTQTRPAVKIWVFLFRLILKSDGRTARVNIVITTGRVWVGLVDQYMHNRNVLDFFCYITGESLNLYYSQYLREM